MSDQSSLHVTAAKWWIPELGYNIGEQGILPDIELSEEEVNSSGVIQIAIDYMYDTYGK